jgi:hypothetical protein
MASIEPGGTLKALMSGPHSIGSLAQLSDLREDRNVA